MTRSTIRLAPALAVASTVAVLGFAPVADGRDAPVPDPAAAARRVRAALPAPAEGLGFEWKGDLVVAGEPIGSVHYTVDCGAYHDEPVWLISEAATQDVAGAEVHTETSLYLAKDLTLLRGESQVKSQDGATRITFVRGGDGFDLVKTVTTAKGEQPPVEIHAKAPADATAGRAALLLFLRGAPKTAATYSLPLFVPSRAAAATGNEHDAPESSGDAVLEVKGAAKYGEKPNVHDTWLVAYRFLRGGFDLHLAPKDRSLVAIAGIPPTADVVPKGTAPKKTLSDDDKPATSWKAAFMKFGHGYHMAISKYLDAAFHWPTMYAHEVEAKSWSPENDGDLAKFKAAWIGEFMQQSKRRARGDADQLLLMTLATGQATTKGDDAVVFAAHAEFGGGTQRTYHLQRIDGVWYITRIDYKE